MCCPDCNSCNLLRSDTGRLWSGTGDSPFTLIGEPSIWKVIGNTKKELTGSIKKTLITELLESVKMLVVLKSSKIHDMFFGSCVDFTSCHWKYENAIIRKWTSVKVCSDLPFLSVYNWNKTSVLFFNIQEKLRLKISISDSKCKRWRNLGSKFQFPVLSV